jgi:hypothetical protein
VSWTRSSARTPAGRQPDAEHQGPVMPVRCVVVCQPQASGASYDMNAAFMLFQRREGGIHALRAGNEQGSPVTRITKSAEAPEVRRVWGDCGVGVTKVRICECVPHRPTR